MSLYGFTEFGNETRDKFRDTIFERMDTVFSNWLYGEYDDCELDYIIENDLEVRSMCSMYESLWATFRVGVNYVDKFDWLESRGMSHFPTRANRVVSFDPLIILSKKIYDRMDVVYSEWQSGKYRNKDLRRALEDDWDVIAMTCRWRQITNDNITPDDWAAERQGVDELDYLNNRTIPRLEPIALFQRARTFSMHGPSGEVEHVIEPMAGRAPRRSTRAKKQREFYCGF
jgi:hypothetical protein